MRRKLRTKIKEHKNDNKYSTVNKHLKHAKHQLDKENIKIIHNQKKKRNKTNPTRGNRDKKK